MGKIQTSEFKKLGGLEKAGLALNATLGSDERHHTIISLAYLLKRSMQGCLCLLCIS